uniref:Uncharacterized protein n=1 Tax=Megaviridae environmental sample TaxID=1737588 RepID=A0A5J6VJ06_9VIRU|nr:MAG: hypothetical protein [Megaviridae environmental sample]
MSLPIFPISFATGVLGGFVGISFKDTMTKIFQHGLPPTLSPTLPPTLPPTLSPTLPPTYAPTLPPQFNIQPATLLPVTIPYILLAIIFFIWRSRRSDGSIERLRDDAIYQMQHNQMESATRFNNLETNMSVQCHNMQKHMYYLGLLGMKTLGLLGEHMDEMEQVEPILEEMRHINNNLMQEIAQSEVRQNSNCINYKNKRNQNTFIDKRQQRNNKIVGGLIIGLAVSVAGLFIYFKRH